MILALLVVGFGSLAVGSAGLIGYKVHKRKSFKRRYRDARRRQAKRAKENAQWQKDRVTIARDVAAAKKESREAKETRRAEARERREEARDARRRAAEERAAARQAATQPAVQPQPTPQPVKKAAAKTTTRRPASPTTQAAAGVCNAKTEDGSACQRPATKPGMCGIDSHRPGPWASKGGKRRGDSYAADAAVATNLLNN